MGDALRELVLTENFRKKLKKDKRIIYFNCSKLSDITTPNIRKRFNRQQYILVDNNLYIQDFGKGIKYILVQENFLPSKNSKTLESGLNKKT